MQPCMPWLQESLGQRAAALSAQRSQAFVAAAAAPRQRISAAEAAPYTLIVSRADWGGGGVPCRQGCQPQHSAAQTAPLSSRPSDSPQTQ